MDEKKMLNTINLIRGGKVSENDLIKWLHSSNPYIVNNTLIRILQDKNFSDSIVKEIKMLALKSKKIFVLSFSISDFAIASLGLMNDIEIARDIYNHFIHELSEQEKDNLNKVEIFLKSQIKN